MTTRRTFKSLSLAAVLGIAALGGCESLTGGDSSDRDRDGDVTVSRDRTGDRYDDRYRDREPVDRAPSTANKVPKDARVVDSGSDRLSYTANNDGSAYLYDEDARTVVWDQKLRDGDRVSIDPDNNRVEVNGRSESRLDLNSNHRFRLYFLEGLKSTRDRDRF